MNVYDKLIVYYFSGTGNSRNVASWISGYATTEKIDCELIDIAKADRLLIAPPPENSLLIFISPVHGFNYPPIMLYFISRFPKGKNKIVLMNTRAGMLIKKWITPGLSGITFYFSAAIFVIKGYSVKALFPVNLPSNWISVHPGLNERTVKYLHEKNKEKVTAFAKKILSGKTDYRSLRELIQDLLISPVAILYYFIGRFFLAKTYYASSDCDNCGVCIKSCPVQAITEVGGKPFWTFHCESCMRCMGNCPKKAIETAHGFVSLISILFSSVILVFFYNFVKINNGIIRFIIEPFIFLSLLAISYRAAHFLKRFKIFERLLVYTSLTKYKFWGRRYRALKT